MQQLPTIHLNGTGKESLLRENIDAMEKVRDAMEKVRDAMDALRKATPNARDYYPQGPDAYTKALDEHMARRQKLADVLDELDIIAEHIADSANTWNRKGLHHAYALRIDDLELGNPEAFTLATRLCKDLRASDSFPAIVKRLRKAGAVRYAVGDVTSKSGSFGREFMPRKYSKNKSTAYWNAITSGLDVAA